MSEHAKELEPKIRKIQDHINRIVKEKKPDLLLQTVHKPPFTTPREVEFVHAVLDSLTQQIEGFDRSLNALVTIADRIVRPDGATKVA
jgi:hypothetical protein